MHLHFARCSRWHAEYLVWPYVDWGIEFITAANTTQIWMSKKCEASLGAQYWRGLFQSSGIPSNEGKVYVSVSFADSHLLLVIALNRNPKWAVCLRWSKTVTLLELPYSVPIKLFSTENYVNERDFQASAWSVVFIDVTLMLNRFSTNSLLDKDSENLYKLLGGVCN